MSDVSAADLYRHLGEAAPPRGRERRSLSERRAWRPAPPGRA